MANLSEISRAVESLDLDQVVVRINELVSIDTTIPPGEHYADLIEVVSPYLENIGFSLEIVQVPEELVQQIPFALHGPRPNLVATKDFGQKDTITFYGHMDVVPAPNEGSEKWRTNPYEAVLKGKRIFGRGVADMKGFIAIVILALELMHQQAFTPQYNIRVVVCTDEEVGVQPGVSYLARQGYIEGTVFCGDGPIWDKYVVGAPGLLVAEIETMGKTCHAGMNFLGVNAVDAMIPILDELLVLKQDVEARRSQVPGVPRTETPDERFMSPMFNMDVIRGGEKFNIVPPSCKLTIDRRVIPEESLEVVEREILDAVERGRSRSVAIDVRVAFHHAFFPLFIDPTTPAAMRLQAVIKAVNTMGERTLDPIAMPASTDMGFLSEILDTHDILLRGVANVSSNTHGVNETISVKDVYVLIKEILLFLCGDIYL